MVPDAHEDAPHARLSGRRAPPPHKTGKRFPVR